MEEEYLDYDERFPDYGYDREEDFEWLWLILIYFT